MPTVKREGLPTFWATGIAKLLIGENPCRFEQWMKGHYRIEKVRRPDDGKLTKWKADHTEQLTQAIDRFTSQGWKCQVERYWRLTGETAIIAGKADLITTKDGSRPTIRDIKGGIPRDSDAAQVCIYQICLPLAWRSPYMQFDGEVIYPSHSVPVPHAQAMELRSQLFALLRKLAGEARPPASPSEQTCRWCDVGKADCPDRVEQGEQEPESVGLWTSEF